MLHARIDIVQILDRFQVGAVITTFAAGADPVEWVQRPLMLEMPSEAYSGDDLTTVINAIRLWSEMTNKP